MLSISRAQNAMVNNPIYNGHMYESIQPVFDALTANVSTAQDEECSQTDETAYWSLNLHHCTSSSANAKDKCARRYVDQLSSVTPANSTQQQNDINICQSSNQNCSPSLSVRSFNSPDARNGVDLQLKENDEEFSTLHSACAQCAALGISDNKQKPTYSGDDVNSLNCNTDEEYQMMNSSAHSVHVGEHYGLENCHAELDKIN